MSETLTSTRSPARKATQAARRRASERALIEAALEIAVEQGVGAVTFEAIGARAGYSRGLATQHFGSKQGLIRAVITHLHGVMDDAARPAVEDPRLSGRAALSAYVAAFFESFRQSSPCRSYFIFLAGAVAERGDTLPLFAGSHETVKRLLMDLARRGFEDGSVPRSVDAESAALAVGSLLMGVSIQHLVDPSLDLARIERQTAKVVEQIYAGEARVKT